MIGGLVAVLIVVALVLVLLKVAVAGGVLGLIAIILLVLLLLGPDLAGPQPPQPFAVHAASSCASSRRGSGSAGWEPAHGGRES